MYERHRQAYPRLPVCHCSHVVIHSSLEQHFFFLCTLFFLGTGSFNGNEMHTAICQGAVHSSQPTSKLILHVVEKMIMCGDELRTVRRSSQPNRFHL